jgi:hypothetical protein
VKVLLDEVIDTDYGQLDLVYSDDGGFDGVVERFFSGQVNGLVGAADPHGVYLHFGRRSGGSRLRIVLLDSAPADDPRWEDVVEVSTTVPPPGLVRWMSWAGETSGELGSLAPGPYRVRVSARGRDAGAEDEFADEVVDFYLVELWPAPHAADAVIRTQSENAAYWHREWGQLR